MDTYNLAPLYLKELVQIRDPKNNSLRADNDYFLLEHPPIPLSCMTENAFSFSGPRLWNSLPYSIRSCETLNTFKSKLKTYYFNIAFNDV